MNRTAGKRLGDGRPVVFQEGISRRALWKGRRNVEIRSVNSENGDPCASGASPVGQGLILYQKGDLNMINYIVGGLVIVAVVIAVIEMHKNIK